MFDLTCSYLDDDDIDHEAEKQWIFKTLHKLEKEEEIKSLLNDFSKFSSLYDEAVAAGLKKKCSQRLHHHFRLSTRRGNRRA